MSRDVSLLGQLATQIRCSALQMTTQAGSGHPGGSLSSADLMAALLAGDVVRHRPSDPQWLERDRFVLSAGHLGPAWYAGLAHVGYFPVEELMTLRQFGSRLQGHPHLGSLPGIETSTGSLGQGFSVAVGMALGFKLQHQLNHVYCLMGDGEQGEGQVWEAASAAGKYGLVNLICAIDQNGMQENGPTAEILPHGDLRVRYEALGWRVQVIDGHNMIQILDAFDAARAGTSQPQLIVAQTVMGKGVRFMEADGYKWHGKALNQEQLEQAIIELNG